MKRIAIFLVIISAVLSGCTGQQREQAGTDQQQEKAQTGQENADPATILPSTIKKAKDVGAAANERVNQENEQLNELP